MLLERGPALETLATLRSRAGSDRGRMAFVGGEAGIGKTTLLRHFAPPAADVLWGACDPLTTPRPLGPLHDMAGALGPAVADALAREAGRAKLFDAVLEALDRRAPCLVMEDLHWADEATLDLLAWLGRRIERTRALLIASYRDDEIGPRHPLRRVLGALPGATRIGLTRLTPAAVRDLAAAAPTSGIGAHRLDAQTLYRLSGGNPFFVTELLAVGDRVGPNGGVPVTVRDAVIARIAPLPEPARAFLDAAAVLGARLDVPLLETVTGGDATAALADCLAAGVLQETRDAGILAFRHELARQAVLGALSAPQRLALHRRVLQALRDAPEPDAAQVAEQAEAARDRTAVLEYATRAAREAAAAGARRQAQQQYARALRFADDTPPLPDGDLARLLESFAHECLATGDRQAGVDARRRAVALRAARGEVREQAENLCRLTNLLVHMARSAEADAALAEALELLRPLPPCRELAYAWRTQAHMRLLHNDDAEAAAAADRAIALAERLGDAEALISALNSKGAAVARSDYAAGVGWLERSRELARQAGRTNQVFNADINLAEAALDNRDWPAAERHAKRADTLAVEMQMERCTTGGRLALATLHLGRWLEAGEHAGLALAEPTDEHLNRAVAQVALGRLRARRGDSGDWQMLDAALQAARSAGYLDLLAMVHAARAEAAWLQGELDRCGEEARVVYDLAVLRRYPWTTGELAWWRHAAGETFDPPKFVAAPYASMIAGRWREAADGWSARHSPFEQALALAQAQGVDAAQAQREAIEIFEHLGAPPAAEALRRRLRDAGVRGLPRGPRAATRDNTFGLTRREQQVLALLCDGLRNAEIAARLHRSVRTIDHHVEAVLAKLGVDSRLAAVQAAGRAGLVPSAQTGQSRPEK